MDTRKPRLVPIGAIIAVAALGLASCGSSSSGSGGGSGSSAPIKIGFVDTQTGPEAIYAKSHIIGAQFAASQASAGGGVLGHKVEVVSEDDQWTPSLGVKGLRDLQAKGVHYVIAGSNTDVCNAEIPLLQQMDMVMFTAGCSTDSQTGPHVNPNLFRVNSTSGTLASAMATFICKQFPSVKRVDALTYNYTTTRSIQTDLNADMKQLCGTVPGTQTSVTDGTGAVLPYLSGLQAKLASDSARTTVLSLNTIGPNLVDFLKTGLSIGLYNRYLATFTTLSAFTSVAAAAAPDVPPVYVSADYSYDAFTNPENTTFVTAWKAAHGGTPPNSQELDGYREMSAILAGIRKANSVSTSAVKSALAGLTFGDPTGTITIDAQSHQGALPMAIVKYDGSSVTGVATVPAAQAGG
jgi:ABC-type branched-subunit amino acid transport system substrate-binding protein